MIYTKSILILATQDTRGGGGFKASERLHRAYQKNNIYSKMCVATKYTDLYTVNGPETKVQKAANLLKPVLVQQMMRLQLSSNRLSKSPALLPSGLTRKLNLCEADVLHLHWICNEFLSVEDIGRLKKPIVWTLHDMWPFSGAEHYGDDGENARWRVGYRSDNRPFDHQGIDIDRWVWNRKRRAWKRPIHIIAPSQWLANCAKESSLMQNWPISVIPYLLDIERFRPWDKMMARQLLGLPQHTFLVLFGAVGGGRDPRKGWDLLKTALAKVATQIENVAGVVFGQSEPSDSPQLGLPIYWMGHLHDEVTLALLYSAADVTVIPSRQDNLPQCGMEAQTCGCPVVAFNTCGLPSVVVHEKTGYLATPFDVNDLAQGITWVLGDSDRRNRLSTQARDRAVRLWSPEVVVKQHIEVYEKAIALHQQQTKNF